MARSKYPGIGLAAVKKLCNDCIRKNKGNRQEYAGLLEENGNYYLVDGFRMVRFRYDLPELKHAQKNEIGSQPSMLYFIENAKKNASKVGYNVTVCNIKLCKIKYRKYFIELPAMEEVKAAVAMNKAVKRDKKHTLMGKEPELPFPLAGGRIWVNPSYLLDMMQIFPLQRMAVMTGNAFQPIYFCCDGADGILLPINCDNPKQTMERWEERKAQAQKETVEDEDFSDIL